MDYSGNAPESQGGIDPLVNDSALSPQSTITIAAKTLFDAGAGCCAVGLACWLLMREEWSFHEDRLRWEKPRREQMLKELALAGFLEQRSGLWHITKAHRP